MNSRNAIVRYGKWRKVVDRIYFCHLFVCSPLTISLTPMLVFLLAWPRWFTPRQPPPLRHGTAIEQTSAIDSILLDPPMLGGSVLFLFLTCSLSSFPERDIWASCCCSCTCAFRPCVQCNSILLPCFPSLSASLSFLSPLFFSFFVFLEIIAHSPSQGVDVIVGWSGIGMSGWVKYIWSCVPWWFRQAPSRSHSPALCSSSPLFFFSLFVLGDVICPFCCYSSLLVPPLFFLYIFFCSSSWSTMITVTIDHCSCGLKGQRTDHLFEMISLANVTCEKGSRKRECKAAICLWPRPFIWGVFFSFSGWLQMDNEWSSMSCSRCSMLLLLLWSKVMFVACFMHYIQTYFRTTKFQK